MNKITATNFTRQIPAVLSLLLLLSVSTASAYTTQGDGTTYTLKRLSQTEASGVMLDDEDDAPYYLLTESITIAEGDRFVMDDGVTVQFDDEVQLTIKGEADFQLKQGATFESAYGTDADYVSPIGIEIDNESSQTCFENCTFYTVGLKNSSSQGLTLSNCNFYYNNGAIGQAALMLGVDGAPFTISNCHFEGNAMAAIAGAANYRNPLLIEDCTFFANGTANGNTPQLNLTVADSVVIRRCTVIGNPDLNMVGGIGISNFFGATDVHALVSNCTVADNRYGIALMGPSDIRIENNKILNNRYETNPNNGGSGINLYDPYQKATAVVAGNTIEGNLWGITIIGCKDVNLGQPASSDIQSPGGNVFKDNGNTGMLYDVYNNSTLTVYAQNNTWNVSEQTPEQIESVIFHKVDDQKLGEVIFMPAAGSAAINSADSNCSPAPSEQLYTIGSQRVNNHHQLPHGIYVKHGKKVVR